MKSKSLSFLALSLLFISCNPNASQDVNFAVNNNNITVIDLDNSKEQSELRFSSILKKPRTIILETNENCLIKRIHGIEMYNNRIYIHDDKMKRLFVFDSEGKFLHEIGKPGAGPGEYIELSDFSIDRENNVIYLWDEVKKNALKYNLNTSEFISSTHVPEIAGQSYSFLFKNDKFYINSTSKRYESDNYLLNEVDCHSGHITKKILPADSYNKGWNGPLRLSHSNFYSKNSKAPIFTEMFSDTIVSVTNGGIIPSYVIKSKHIVPKKEIDKINERFYGTTGQIDLMSLYINGYIYQISNFLRLGKYIYFQYTKGTDIIYALLDCKNGNIETSVRLKNDYVFIDNYIRTDLIYSDDKACIGMLETKDLHKFINAISNNKINKEIDKYEQLVNLDEESNPVLFYHEFKE